MSVLVIRGDARCLPLPDASVDLIVTSPPYFGLRSYTDGGEHYDGQIGSEATPAEYVAALVGCTREWVRVLKPCGSLFVNLGDKYSGGGSGENGTGKSSLNGHGGEGTQRDRVKLGRSRPVPGALPKSLLGLPWRYALAVTDQLGLILRAEIIWAKPNGLPESVTDRVRRAHEQVFHFTRLPRYYSAVDEIREPHQPASVGRAKYEFTAMQDAQRYAAIGHANTARKDQALHPLGKLPGSVWHIPSQPLTVPPALGVDHFAAFPMELPRRIIAGWSPPGVCTACGEGRRPVAGRDRVQTRKGLDSIRGINDGSITPIIGTPGFGQRAETTVTITGYTCACPQPDAPVRPAIVLDPFSGTGTVPLVAHALGRHGVSVDRSMDYTRLARWRTTDRGELARALQVPKPPAETQGQEALWA